MKRFIFKLLIFLVPIVLFLLSGLFLPSTPRSSKSLLFSYINKDSLLNFTNSPRIIFVGGSNLSFGLNSNLIKDSLKLNPINTGVHIKVGLKYMLSNTLQYIKRDDIVVVIPEYNHFFISYEEVSDELLRTVVEVSPKNQKLLSLKQCLFLLEYVPRFTLTKFKKSEYYNVIESDVYGLNSFNEFGDVDAHWKLKNRNYKTGFITGNFNEVVMRNLKKFERDVENKGAKVYISFPGIDELSYYESESNILEVEKRLHEYEFNILGNSKRYIFNKNEIFDGYYHLNKIGVDRRTINLIEDIRKNI